MDVFREDVDIQYNIFFISLYLAFKYSLNENSVLVEHI